MEVLELPKGALLPDQRPITRVILVTHAWLAGIGPTHSAASQLRILDEILEATAIDASRRTDILRPLAQRALQEVTRGR
jgi:hypothetical protein